MSGVWEPPRKLAESPYPGLRPFSPRERDIFFGREQMIDQVLARLNKKQIVVVHGTSGCGKSSLIAAGVLPQLAQRRARLGRVLRIGTCRPGAQPMRALIDLLLDLLASEETPVTISEIHAELAGDDPCAGVARLAARAGIDQLCIVIDQFEELFRVAENVEESEATRFAELLVQLCGCYDPERPWWQVQADRRDAPPEPERLSFILTMRSEFLGDCARYPGLAEVINRTQYLLPNMGRDDLIRAIREPAEVFGGRVEQALAERMADDALREKDPLPLVQHALMQMWSASADRHLTVESYEAALQESRQGAEVRRRAPLGAILADHADLVLREITRRDPAMGEAVEFIFRALTMTDREGRGVRYPQTFARLVQISGVGEPDTRSIVDSFRREGVSFLTPYQGEDEICDDTVIDISHEALIRTWPRMSDDTLDSEAAKPRGWVQREAQDGLLWRWLAFQAELFRSNKGARLDVATVRRVEPWFDRIRQSPEWARRHLVRSEERPEVLQEPEWRAVEHLVARSRRRALRLRLLGLVVLLIPVVGTIGVLGWYALFLQTENQVFVQQQAERQQLLDRRSGEIDSLSARLASTIEGSQPAAITERVSDQVARAATRRISSRETIYLWVGTRTRPAVIANLLDSNGRPVSPNRVRLDLRYNLAQHTIVRRGFPTARGAAPTRGILRQGSAVIASDVASIAVGDRNEYWIRGHVAGPVLAMVRLNFAENSRLSPADWDVVRHDLRTQLTRAHYDVEEPIVSSAAAGRLNALYCHAEDRESAARLAITVTRWFQFYAPLRGLGVIEAQGDNCAGVGRGRLILMLDFSATPSPPPQAPAAPPAPAATPS